MRVVRLPDEVAKTDKHTMITGTASAIRVIIDSRDRDSARALPHPMPALQERATIPNPGPLTARPRLPSIPPLNSAHKLAAGGVVLDRGRGDQHH